ncbi:SGNH/GDSL hydrolase family protein [Paractinoplanes atraurantiacus]|uniref:Lysophospholipase L1 n=1 Tax=Paractinoplanes atraurantiacus TaxID=1036182 RepID=A0A285HFF1_9ACTN|nr:SGNH/GDSL hydrolase family protein [Actinoplanes atraurantiacus]SNY34460.1 Lysophospholipase L1 [Actinoplanes atraurantiacus]
MNSRLAGRLGGIILTAAAALAATLAGPATAVAADPGAPLKVMPLGDSITWGSGSADSRVGNRTGALTASGYRIDLRERLEAAGMDVDFVGSRQAGPAGTDRDNEGHPGWRIDQIAANVDGWLDTYQPDVILLHIGTNDMAQNRSVDASAAGLSALIDQIRAARPAADLFVQQLVQGHIEPYKSRIAAYNKTIPGIVAGKDAKVHLVDQSSIGGLSLFDNLHPNDDGYAKMAFNLYQAMAEVHAGYSTRPTGTDPYAATSATLCFRINKTVAGKQTWHAECSPWTLRTVWQRPDIAPEHYLVYVKPHYTTKKVHGTAKVWIKGRYIKTKKTRVWAKPHYETRKVIKTVRVLIAAHYETRTRIVATWLSDDPYLTNAKK